MTGTATRMMWASDIAPMGDAMSVWDLPSLGFPVISGLPYRPSGLTHALDQLRRGRADNDRALTYR